MYIECLTAVQNASTFMCIFVSDEIIRDTNELNGLPPIPGSSNIGTIPNGLDPAQVGEKRALTTPEGPPAKRLRYMSCCYSEVRFRSICTIMYCFDKLKL